MNPAAQCRNAPAAGLRTRPELCECRAVLFPDAFRAGPDRILGGLPRPLALRLLSRPGRWSLGGVAYRFCESLCRPGVLRTGIVDDESAGQRALELLRLRW